MLLQQETARPDMTSLPKKHIPSGSFEVSGPKPVILEALLGSCVGVLLIDGNVRIGGLYHILLPEFPAGGDPFNEEMYASSGMPRYLQALYDAGCTAENMEAVLAGGALIGRLSPLDMQLDIGGRTIEVVQKLLRDAGIPVAYSETGGFFGTKLQLNLQTFRYEIEPAYPTTGAGKTGKAFVRKISNEELNRAIADIKPIPQIALKIIRTLQAEDYDMKEVASQIQQDQVISARVINICNSAFVGAKKEINSINHALVVLGSQLVLQLVLSSAMESFYMSSNRGYSMSRGGVYHHAVTAAIVSEHIAGRTGKSEPAIAYTGGLLHDIGKVLLDQFVGQSTPHFYRKLYSDGDALLDVEKSILGIDHAEAGAHLAELWSFPPSLKDVVAHHGHPELARNDPDLTHVVYLANLLLSRFDACREMENIDTGRLGMRLDRLGLDTNSLPEVIAGIPWKTLHTPGYF
jgi:putative nucleotidyltransferase with HDIG domain